MRRCTKIGGFVLLLTLLAAPQVAAQDASEPGDEASAPVAQDDEDTDTASPDDGTADDDGAADDEASADDADDEPADDNGTGDADDEPADDDGTGDADDEPADDNGAADADDEPADDAPSADEEWENGDDWGGDDEWGDDEWGEEWDEDIEFVALDELDDAMLDRITPVSSFPFVEYGGQLRVRSRARYNFDLDTRGTSAVLAPVDTQVASSPHPDADVVNEDAQMLWTTDMRFRLAPTIHLTEGLRLHTDFEFLDNVALGDDRRHSYFVAGQPSANQRLFDSSTGQPGPVHVREAYGELNSFFGTISAGRMLNHWGLGLFANDGKCLDCDWGDQVDRLAFRTRVFDFYLQGSYDLVRAGLNPMDTGFQTNHPYALGQLDQTNQWTLKLFRSPLTREEREQQAYQLGEGNPVLNGGAYFSTRHQDGTFVDHNAFSVDSPTDPIYRGLSLYTADLWAEMTWNPAQDRHIHLELEALGTFGSVENATNGPVGYERDAADEPVNINCFDDDARDNNPQACRTNSDGDSTASSVLQLGMALESEFDMGWPINFGVNGGFASGGDAPNWGYGAEPADQLAYTRFNPDYHVDLILFREVIGTVTNAAYFNPYIKGSFLDNGLQRFEVQFDAISSRALETAGAPGDSPWLGLELDGSLRYIATDAFVAALDAGILFPFGGLDAVADQERLNHYGDLGPFGQDRDAGLAWTVQGRLTWDF